MGEEELFGTLTIYRNIPFKDFSGNATAKLCAITSVRCTKQQAKGYKADWLGMNGADYAYRFKVDEYL